jgi:hypothetical protein
VQQRSEEARAAFIGEKGVPLFNVFINLLSKVRRVPFFHPLVLAVVVPMFDLFFPLFPLLS